MHPLALSVAVAFILAALTVGHAREAAGRSVAADDSDIEHRQAIATVRIWAGGGVARWYASAGPQAGSVVFTAALLRAFDGVRRARDCRLWRTLAVCTRAVAHRGRRARPAAGLARVWATRQHRRGREIGRRDAAALEAAVTADAERLWAATFWLGTPRGARAAHCAQGEGRKAQQCQVFHDDSFLVGWDASR